ncbi:MAG TPA: NAD(P)/FAD-dependent oxidoreductase, partial [Streptosporangiaceae bacterium]|nr:NAD(P)/FAD-dependent oxidoreductase [Streptosporangiaceae bacterium]
MAERLTATVVGGGIAGLASAISLAQAGWAVTVLERSPAFREVGAGLAITRNGMSALEALGVGDAGVAEGYETVSAGIQDPGGRWLLRIPDTPDVRATTTIWGIHRQRLHAALRRAAEAADNVELVTGAEVSTVRPSHPAGEPAAVTWQTATGQHTSEADLVVAADGIRSTVREQLFPHVR